jgi:adenylylsulfate kinase-like enzyme
VGWLASRLEAHGALVIVAVDAGTEDARRYARSLAKDFVEVHVSAAAEIVAARRSTVGELSSFEPPVQPELSLDTGRLTVDEAGAEVLAWLEEWSNA